MNKPATRNTLRSQLFLLGAFACTLAFANEAIAEDPAGVYQAPSAEPTEVETLLLEYINRSRANPAKDASLIRNLKRTPRTVDLNLFETEMAEFSPSAPLVFDLALLKASRWHSWYQIKHGQGHTEEAGKAGFSGKGPGDRIQAAGYDGRGVGENVFLNSSNPWQCHCGFVIDWGAGPGGMQPERGHRKNILSSRWRLAGVGAIPHGGSNLSVTQEFGGSKQRMMGGVVYNDKNGNRFYDLEEGVGGVTFSVADTSAKSWSSGAYAIAIPKGQQKVNVQINNTTFVTLLPEGDKNVKFDVFVADVARYAKNSLLLESIKKIPDNERNADRRLAALTDLFLATRDSLIEESIYDEVIELTTEAQQKLNAAMDEVRELMSVSEVVEAKKRIAAQISTYRRSAVKTWFTDAKNCLPIVEAYQRLEKLKENGKPPSKGTIERTLLGQQKTFDRLSVAEWQTFALKVGGQIRELGPSE